jgi:hypothetical protein
MPVANLDVRRMRHRGRPILPAIMGLAGLALSASSFAQTPAPKAAPVAAQPVTPQQMAEYRRKLAEYAVAQEQFNAQANPYWASVAAKRKSRAVKRSTGQAIKLDDYVLTQPPKYTGPDRPADPSRVSAEAPAVTIPVVADFLKNASEEFQFEPKRSATELAFKKAYASVASAAGLTRDQAVRIYGFEAGGNGKYDVQAGLEYDKPGAKAISTALGYNQLLTTNSVELLAEQGDQFVKTLKGRAVQMSGQQKADLERKIMILQAMIA